MRSSCRAQFLAISAALMLYACGGGDSAPPPSSPPPPAPAALSVLAGDPYGAGNVDGTGVAAAFQSPYGVATDSAGNLYVTDGMNHTIRKITLAGVVTTLAGTAGVAGSADGRGTSAQFSAPIEIAADGAGNLYVTDDANGNIREITPDGVVTTLPGSAGVYGNGIAIDSMGNVYVADYFLDAILKITPAGVVTTFAGGGGAGLTDGTGAAAKFQEPNGLTIDSTGNLFVADSGNGAIRKITPGGVVTTLARFNTPGTPEGIGVDSAGNLYVTDGDNTIRKITPAGVVTTLAGTAGVIGSADGSGTAATFNSPAGIAIDGAGIAYVADAGNNAIRRITPAEVVTTFAGGSGGAGYADGTGTAAQFNSPQGLATDDGGNIYAVDFANAAIRKITPAGNVTTRSQIPTPSLHYADLYGSWIAINRAGVLYFVEETSQIEQIGPLFASYAIRLLNSAGLSVSLCAETYVISNPCPLSADITTDAQGNAYLTGDQTINKIDPVGNVTILAGATGVTGSTDGLGAAARFNLPSGITADGVGSLYVTDSGNNTIRKITPAGVVTTLAGTAGAGGSKDGVGAAAEFFSPSGIAIDSSGNVYVADTGNNTIRKITPAGVVSTIVGQPRRIGFTSGALPGALSNPGGLALFGRTLYTTCNNAIVQVTNVP